MARNKLLSQARKQRAQRRDGRRLQAGDLESIPSSGPSPERHAAGKELLEAFRARLTGEERRIAELRGQGHEWLEIANRLGGTPEAKRMQLARAVKRIAQEVDFDGI